MRYWVILQNPRRWFIDLTFARLPVSSVIPGMKAFSVQSHSDSMVEISPKDTEESLKTALVLPAVVLP
jgi:hypothetical protein